MKKKWEKNLFTKKQKSWIDSNLFFPLFFILNKFHHLHKAMGLILHHGTFNTTNQEQQCDELITTLTLEGSMAMCVLGSWKHTIT
jgi:heme/copper-type cytochrome/quinol oxidase subunit 3